MSSAAFKQLIVAAIERDQELKGELSNGLAAIELAIREDPRLELFLANPSVSLEFKERELASVVPQANEQARHTMLMLVRDGLLPKFGAFSARVRAAQYIREGKIAAIVESAVPLSDGQQEEVKQTLQERFGREPVLTLEVKPELIGGLRVTVGDTQFDGTLAGRLERLRERIATIH
jgi:F-type H+-transporting ATPase subunit delta